MPVFGPEDCAPYMAQLERIIASQQFAASKRLCSFLRFVVEAQLADRGDQIKERVIGVEVFGRGSSFDPSSDNIVRVEAARLRHKLREYYEGPGAGDPIRIEVPKGSYAPTFTIQPAADATEVSAPPDTRRRRTFALGALGVAGATALMVGVAIFAPAPKKAPDREAVALCERGRALWNQRSVKASIAVLKQATDRAPDYADAWIGLADAYAVMVGNDYPDSGAYVEPGVAAARRAMELNPKAGRPHAAMAAFHRYAFQFAAAEQENRLAVQLSPNDAVAHQWLGHLLMYEHRNEEALAELMTARRLDPTQPMIWVNIGEVYYWMGDLDTALRWYKKTLDRFPNALAAALGIEGIEIAKRQYAAALKDVNQRLREYPDDPGLNNHLRICLEALKGSDVGSVRRSLSSVQN